MAYDYTVLAGTQGYFNHKKMDRMLKLAHEQRLPVVLFAEGGCWTRGQLPVLRNQAEPQKVDAFR